MKNFFTTQSQLERYCPVYFFIHGYVATHQSQFIKWEIVSVKRDVENQNLYYSHYDIPSQPNSELKFTCELIKKRNAMSEYRFTLISKKCTVQ